MSCSRGITWSYAIGVSRWRQQSHADNVARREAWEARSAKARKLLEDLGGAANFKDAKLDWEDGDDFDA